MRVRVLRRFVLGPDRMAKPGDVLTLDERKDAVLIGSVRSMVEVIPDGVSADPQPQQRDPNPTNRDPQPSGRRRRRGES